MSADNWLGIVKCKDGKYRGYNLSASMNYGKEESPDIDMTWEEIEEQSRVVFVADTFQDALMKACKENMDNYYEYGFSPANCSDEVTNARQETS